MLSGTYVHGEKQMASNQTTKPKGRKRKLLPSDYTEFGDPSSAKTLQSTDKLEISGISNTEQEVFGEISDLNRQKNMTNLLHVPIFHGDLLPLSQAGKFIPKFQTKLNKKSQKNDHMNTEDVAKKRPVSGNECIEDKCSTEKDDLYCDFQLHLETDLLKDSKISTDHSETGKWESKQTAEEIGQTVACVEEIGQTVASKEKINMASNGACDELDMGRSEHLPKKSGKRRLQKMPTKTLGTKKIKSTSVSRMSKAQKLLANNSCNIDGTEEENMKTVDIVENGAVDEKSNLATSAGGDGKNKSFKKSENLYPDASMSNIGEMNGNLDWIDDRVGAFDAKLGAADTGICMVKIERLKLLDTDSSGAKFPQVDLHTTLNVTKKACIMKNLDRNELGMKTAHSIQQHQNLTPLLQPDVNKVNESNEEKSKILNDIQLFLSNTGNMDKESNRHTEDRTEGSAVSQHASESCPKTSQKTDDQPLVMDAIVLRNYDQKASASDLEKTLQHKTDREDASVKSIDSCKATFKGEPDLTRAKSKEFDALLNAELNKMQKILTTERFNAEAIGNFGVADCFPEAGVSHVEKSKETSTEPPCQSDIICQNPNDLGQGNNLNLTTGQSAHQEPCTTFDDFTDVTDSQMYLVDEESIKKSTASSFTNMPMPTTGFCCPGLAKISKAISTVKYADSLHINEAKRKEGNKILQNMIKELTTVNTQLIRYRREIEKAKKERVEHLRSMSCARQY